MNRKAFTYKIQVFTDPDLVPTEAKFKEMESSHIFVSVPDTCS
jgi:hypothetical protein